MSYSQNDEEKHILEICGDIPNGRFLDIGAYNPKIFSNTRALFERGWGGVLVEPSPGPFLDLLAEYGKCEQIELVCAAVCSGVGLLRFHASEDAVSTVNDIHYQKWRTRADFVGQFFISTVTATQIFNRFGRDFDFINIDIEGHSMETFLDMIRREPELRPKCFCVEHDGSQGEIERRSTTFGYRVRHITSENIILERM
jgi:FkbM family methyltransferase